jgi:hypothetical protein
MNMRHAFVLDLVADERAASDLSVGGVFIPNATVNFDDECHIVLRAGTEDLTVVARAVQITEEGAGFQIEGMTRELRVRIAALLIQAKHVSLDLQRKATLTRSLAATEGRRTAAGSVAPSSRRGARIAAGSISPITAIAPTQRDEALADKARSAQIAADTDTDVGDDDD